MGLTGNHHHNGGGGGSGGLQARPSQGTLHSHGLGGPTFSSSSQHEVVKVEDDHYVVSSLPPHRRPPLLLTPLPSRPLNNPQQSSHDPGAHSLTYPPILPPFGAASSSEMWHYSSDRTQIHH